MRASQKIPFGGRDDNGRVVGSVDCSGKPFNIDDTSLWRAQNLIPNKDGTLIRRGTLKYEADLFVNAGVPGGVGNTELVGDVPVNDVTANMFDPIWCATLSEMTGLLAYATMSSGNAMDIIVSRIGGSGWITNALQVAPDRLPNTFSVAGETYIIWGVNAKGRHGIKITIDGSILGFNISDFSFNGAGNVDFHPKLACNYKARVAFADGNHVVFSDNSDPLTIGNSAVTDRDIIIGEETGPKLTALHNLLLTAEGTPSQSAVLAMKRQGCWLLTGDVDQSTSTDDYWGTLDVVRIESPAGCVSQGSICNTPWGVIWCGPDDIWFMPFRALPIPIGRKISSILKNQPENQSFRIHATYVGGFYRLALFGINQGPNHATPLGEQWWLDLRDGPPENWQTARWYGPQIFNVCSAATAGRIDNTVLGTHYMCVDNREGANGKLIGVHNGLMLVGQQAITVVSHDSPDPRDVGGVSRAGETPWNINATYFLNDQIVKNDDIYNTANGRGPLTIYYVSALTAPSGPGGSGVPGAVEPTWTAGTHFDGEITWTRLCRCISPGQMKGSEALIQVHSKEYSAGDRMTQKTYNGLELNYFLTLAERLTATLAVDGGKLMEAMILDLTTASGLLLGTGLLEIPDINLSEEFVSDTFFPSEDSDSVVGRSCQIQLAETAGICIPELLDANGIDISLIVNAVIGGGEYPVTLASRYYANVTALANAMIAAFNANATFTAALGGVLSLTKSFTFFTIHSSNRAWAPSIGNAGIQYYWSLLGMTNWNLGADDEQVNCTGTEIPYDYGVGQIAFEESNLLFTPFKRRTQ